MDQTHNLFKNDLFVLDVVHFGMVFVHIIEMLDELVDGCDVLCVHYYVHYYHDYFLVLLPGLLGVVGLNAFLEHIDELLEVLLGFSC